MQHLAALQGAAVDGTTVRVTDTQAVVATIAGAAGTFLGVLVAWRSRRREEPETDRATGALIENARSLAILAAKVDALERRAERPDRERAEELTAAVGQVVEALADVREIATRLEHTAEALEHDARLDPTSREKLARVRMKIARGLWASRPTATSGSTSGSSGEDDR
jgi:hypothetical protein